METGENPQVCHKNHDSPALQGVVEMELVAQGRRVVCGGPAAFQADAREKSRLTIRRHSRMDLLNQ
jgi:hypothetical protein